MFWLRVTIDLYDDKKLQWESCSQACYVHPNYRRVNPAWKYRLFDIAMIQAEKSIDRNEIKLNNPSFVGTIRLPDKDWIRAECEIGDFAGYGETGHLLTSTSLEVISKSQVRVICMNLINFNS